NEREKATAIYELINRNKPLLNFWGANDSRNLYERWRDDSSRVKPHTASDSFGRTAASRERLMTDASRSLSLSKNEFFLGNTKRILVYSTREGGTLSFVIDQPYR